MDTILFQSDTHQCIAFDDGRSGPRQALIRQGEHTALIDPRGDLAFGPLALAVARHAPLDSLDFVFTAQEDEKAVGRLQRWLHGTSTRIVTSREWCRFSPSGEHPRNEALRRRRLLLLGHRGGRVSLGKSELRVLPALPAQAIGQPAIYDPVSRILFSGDIGAHETPDNSPCEHFDAVLPALLDRRSDFLMDTRGCREWALIARDLRPHMIMPHRGRPLVGQAAVTRFLDWIETAGARVRSAA
jgi:flavorubredoxin